MKNLVNLIDKVANESLTKRRKVENINDSLVRILRGTNKKLTRLELCKIIANDRILVANSEQDLSEMKANELQALVIQTLKTVKNGLDTSISRSNNNSSFHYNEKYANLELKEDAQNRYYIVEKSKA